MINSSQSFLVLKMKSIIHNIQYILLYPSIWVSLQPPNEEMQVEGNSYEQESHPLTV